MQTRVLYFLLLIASILVSCRSSKNVADTSSVTDSGTSSATVPQQSISNSARSLTTQTDLTARVRARLKYEGSDIGTSGHLRMRMGEVIQLSLLDPFLGITEVGRMEIDPSSILVVDRYNKRYVRLSYDELNRYAKRELDYQTIEFHFWQQALRTDTDQLQFQFPVGSKNVELTLRLSNISDKSDWEAHTNPSNKYDQVTAEELFRSLSDF